MYERDAYCVGEHVEVRWTVHCSDAELMEAFLSLDSEWEYKHEPKKIRNLGIHSVFHAQKRHQQLSLKSSH